MSKAKPFFSTTEKRHEAFPYFKSIKVSITQDLYGDYFKEEWQRKSIYSKDNLPRYQSCANPRCQQGSIDLQQIVEFWPDGENQFRSNGHEGSLGGRKKVISVIIDSMFSWKQGEYNNFFIVSLR